MGLQGYELSIATGTYHTPNVCSSCLGPRETQVEAVVSEKHGNIRTTLRMAFPYCNPCAARAKREKLRSGIVLGASCLLGVVLAVGGGMVLLGTVDFIVAVVIAVVTSCVLSFGLALATRPRLPAAPATARGEAVILKDTSGIVLCTNEKFAELLGKANGATHRPGRTIMSTEAWAPLAALLCGALAALMWAKYLPSSIRSPSRVTSPAPSRPAPAAPARAPTPTKR